MNFRIILTLLLITVMLAACSPAAQTPTQAALPNPGSVSQDDNSQAVPSASDTQVAKESLIAVVAPTPTTQFIYPSLETQEITADTLKNLAEIKMLGDGRYRDVAASADGKWLAVASSLGVRLHSAVTLDETGFIRSSAPIARVVFSPNGSLLAVGGEDGMLRLHPLSEGKPIEGDVREIRAGYFPLLAVGFSPDGSQVAAGSLDRTINVWNTISGERTRSVSGFTLGISTLAFNADGSLLAGASVDGQTRVWRVRTGEVLGISGESDKKRLSASAYPIQLAFSGDGNLLLMLADGTLQKWDWQAKERRPQLLYTSAGGAAGAVFNSDGSQLIIAGQVGTLLSVDTKSGMPVRQFNTGEDILAVAPLPDGRSVALAVYPSTLLLADMETGTVSGAFARLPQGGKLVAGTFSPDGAWLATSHADGLVRIWDTQNYLQYLILQPREQGEIRSLQFSPDGSRLYCGGLDIRGYDTTDLADVLRDASLINSGPVTITPSPVLIIPSAGIVGSMGISPDGSLIAATWQLNNTARIYRLPGGEALASLTLWPDPAEIAVFSTDDGTLAVGAADHNVYTWSLQNLLGYSGEPTSGPAEDLLIRNEFPVLGLAFSPDGNQLAITGSYPQGRVVKTINGGLIYRLKGAKEQITAVTFAPATELIASGDVNGRIRLYTANGEDPAFTLTGHAGAVNWLIFSPDGSQLVSGGEDGTFRIWGISLTGTP
jgi:WD40 repeat protein